MKIFKRRRFTIASTQSDNSEHRNEERRFSAPSVNHEVIYLPEQCTRDTDNGTVSHDVSPQASTAESIALSESDTLMYDKNQQLELQETYNENFTLYLPFLLRQADILRYQTRGSEADCERDYDDQRTIVGCNDTYGLILEKEASKFNLKRQFIIVQEFLKHSSYVFVSKESFTLFKQLRLNRKKDAKNLKIIYDENGIIRRVSITKTVKDGIDENNKDLLVDNRQHIIPLEYKLKGLGLPLFKIQTPYLASFRKHAPFLIFRKYREIPLKPILQGTTNNTDNVTDYESYVYCSVFVKHFLNIRRYILNFTPIGQEPFRIIVFQHNYKPFADFNYKSTRFRAIGTSLSCIYVTNYSPIMKLMIIDDDKPSLCDSIINKKTGFEIQSFIKKKKNSDAALDCNIEDSDDDPKLDNPYPDPGSPLLSDPGYSLQQQTDKYEFISKSMPPFGRFTDSMLYDNDIYRFIPKKFSETGKVEVYQDNTDLIEDPNSTLSVDLDCLVLNCILLTLRESNIRNSVKTTLPQAIPTDN